MRELEEEMGPSLCRLKCSISVGRLSGDAQSQAGKMRGRSSRRKQGRLRRDTTGGGSPAMTTGGYHGAVSHQQDSGPHRRQDPTVCITNQTAYINATFAPGGSTSDYEPGPVIQTTKTVKEVQIGPGITLGYLSLKDYSFITGLSVVEEQQY